MITIKLTDTIPQVENKVNEAIAKEVNLILTNKQTELIQKSKNLISQWISSQPEMVSIDSNVPGSLAGQFGLYPGQGNNSKLAIINAIENSISITFRKFTSKLTGGLEVNFQPNNFLNLLTLPQGFVSYARGNLPWLEWLLLKGDEVIVVNYQYNPATGIGRSGLGNMIGGGFFRVPPQFSGTQDGNFVTRALIGPQQEKEITKIFQEILGA